MNEKCARCTREARMIFDSRTPIELPLCTYHANIETKNRRIARKLAKKSAPHSVAGGRKG